MCNLRNFLTMLLLTILVAAADFGEAASVVNIVSAGVQAGSATYSVAATAWSDSAGFDLSISYDVATLKDPQVASGAMIAGAILESDTGVPGVIRVVCITGDVISGSGEVASITFTRIGSASVPQPKFTSLSLFAFDGSQTALTDQAILDAKAAEEAKVAADAAAAAEAAKVNAVCGTSDRSSFLVKPSSSLCSIGTASAVTGNGPWSWSCAGMSGGSDANCSASMTAVSGTCGTSDNSSFTVKPTSNLCSTGTASGVNGSGPWDWRCLGSNGGTDADCSAVIKVSPVSGACGDSNGSTLSSPPTDLCFSGSASGVSGKGPWNWSCLGSNGGSSVSCSAELKASPVSGVCGSSKGSSFITAPTSNLCSTGTASGVTGSGPWSWSCDGSNGGSNVDCSAELKVSSVNGVCGSSNGTSFLTTPTSNLCSTGTASGVTGSGPWSWSCAGENDGSKADCSASLAVNNSLGSVTYTESPFIGAPQKQEQKEEPKKEENSDKLQPESGQQEAPLPTPETGEAVTTDLPVTEEKIVVDPAKSEVSDEKDQKEEAKKDEKTDANLPLVESKEPVLPASTKTEEQIAAEAKAVADEKLKSTIDPALAKKADGNAVKVVTKKTDKKKAKAKKTKKTPKTDNATK